jgi:hypothetical protein
MKTRSRHIQFARAILAFVLLVASMPAMAGVTFQSSGPSLTQDICHPLQTLDRTSAPSLVSILPSRRPVQFPAEAGFVTEPVLACPFHLSKAPDPPPPKLPA